MLGSIGTTVLSSSDHMIGVVIGDAIDVCPHQTMMLQFSNTNVTIVSVVSQSCGILNSVLRRKPRKWFGDECVMNDDFELRSFR